MKAYGSVKTLAVMVVGVVAMFGIVDAAVNSTGEEPSPTQRLNGTSWKLSVIGSLDKTTFQALEPKDCERCYTLVFDTDTSYRGRSAVNDFSGKYKADYVNHTIQMKIPLRTKMGTYNKDNNLFEDIMFRGRISSFILQGDELKLYNEKNQNYLFFACFFNLN